MNINDKFTVEIIDQETTGRGVARIDNLVVFVSNALIGDTVEVEITKVKKSFAEAKILNIITESKERTNYNCPFYESCGGCDIGHQEYESQLNFKKKKIINSLEKIGGLKDIKVLDVVPSKDSEYRNKISLKVSGNKIGFYKLNSYEIVDIDNCLISNSKINKILKIIKKFIINYPNHNIKEVMIRSTSATMIRIISDEFKLNVEFISEFDSELLINSIIVNNKTIYGTDYINISLLGLMFNVSPDSFFQVNTKQTENLYNKVIEYAELNKNDTVIDLYCGVGTITSVLAKVCKNVIGIEEVEDAIINAKENMLLNNINNAEFMTGKVEDLIDKISDSIDVIVLDPPRNGSDPKTLDSIMKLNPKKIIYVSCDPVTLARDLKTLSTEYDVIEVSPFDLFPNTHHVECIAKLCKKNI